MGPLEHLRRRRRARDLEQRLRELDRLDAELGLGASPAQAPRRGGLRPAHVPAVLVVVLLVGVSVTLWDRPDPAAAGGDVGSYAFLMTQPGSDEPVGYPSCRPVQYVVNSEDAPPGGLSLVSSAAASVSEATGLTLEYVGESDDRPGERRGPDDPVLVAWADEEEVPDLAGRVAGLGGSLAVERLGRRVYVTGTVTLDEEAFDRMGTAGYGPGAQQAVVEHELGHLVGLDHVDDPDQLMYRENVGVPTFQAGDLAGLERLGQVPC
jgi:hypothetical protein